MTYVILTPKLPSSKYQEFGIYSLNFLKRFFKVCSKLIVSSSESEKETQFNKSTVAWNPLPASSSSFPAMQTEDLNSNNWILNNFSFT